MKFAATTGALALALCLAPSAWAVDIEGRVRHATRSEAAAGLTVEFLGLDVLEEAVFLEATTDTDGRFSVRDVPTPAAYIVRVLYGGLSFSGGSVVFRPGDTEPKPAIDVQIYEPGASVEALALANTQYVIELAAGSYSVRQRIQVRNDSQTVVVVPGDGPAAVKVGLAKGHGPVTTAFGKLPDGSRISGDTLSLFGPFYPGDEGFVLDVLYDVPARDGASLETSLPVPGYTEALSLYVRDFGITVDAGELHPARVTRDSSVFYQSFVGFGLTPGTELPLSVRPLPPGTGGSGAASAGLAAALAGGLLFFVARPVLRRREEVAEADLPVSEREVLRQALRDLEHDFETDKLSAADHARLQAELLREAQRVIQKPAAQPPPSETSDAGKCECGRAFGADEAFCPDCGRRAVCSCGYQPGGRDRFCAGCGRAL